MYGYTLIFENSKVGERGMMFFFFFCICSYHTDSISVCSWLMMEPWFHQLCMHR